VKSLKVLSLSLLILHIGAFLYSEQEVPQRIISLGPSITQQLYLLNAEDRLIACTTYCDRPKEAQGKERVATAIEVNLEKVVSLEPDIVLATSLTNHRAIKKLKDLGLNVEIFSMPKNFGQLCEQFLRLGEIIGKEKEAEDIVNKAKTKVALIQREIKALPRQKVFVQLGAKPLHTVNKDSFINSLIEFARGTNTASDSTSGLYSREKVLKDNPAVIIITTMGIIGEKEKEVWKRYNTIDAVKNRRIHIIESYKLCSATPASFVETLKEIVEYLHQEKYE